MSVEYSLEDLIKILTYDFFQTFDIKPVGAAYQIVENISEAYDKIRPGLGNKEPQKLKDLNNYNGLTVPPKSIDGKFIILLNAKIMLENMEIGNYNWVGTIIHETTHVVDFIEYAKLTKAVDYEEMLLIDKNAMFNLWTEFNARSKGYYFVRKYTYEDLMFEESLIENIINRELPFQNEYLYEKYHATNDGFEQCYLVAHYLGRLYTLQLIFPNYFTDDYIGNLDIFRENKWMLEWYKFLAKNNTLEKAYIKFDEMKKILQGNFKFQEN